MKITQSPGENFRRRLKTLTRPDKWGLCVSEIKKGARILFWVEG
jgi:hypothetical protein